MGRRTLKEAAEVILILTRILIFLCGAVCLAQTPSERLKWFVKASVGPASLSGGTVSAAWGTMMNAPREYGPHWEGFGKRYGMRLTGVVTANAMEAGLGALWGEDPRYHRATGQPFKTRVWQVIRMTFLAETANGGTRPAYARYAANAGSNFLSNTWREHSEADAQHAALRIGWGFLGRMAANAFIEFRPRGRHK